MSRSNPNDAVNPCKRWFKWEGGKDKGYLSWYDKETETTNIVEPPFTFLVLDQLNTVTGYDSDNKIGYFANEVRNTKQDILTVRSKHGIEAQGLWESIKNRNFDFTKSVYIAFFDEDKVLKIGNIKFKGSGLSGLTEDAVKANLEEARLNQKFVAKERGIDVKDVPLESYSPAFLKQIGWINFSNSRKDLNQIAVKLIDKIEDKNGNTVFYRPIFEAKTNISKETNDAAIELDKILQEYLRVSLQRPIQNAEVAQEPQEDYRQARDRELEEYSENTNADFTGMVGSNDYRVSDDDIPF